jgi:SAM-dependent methyltransferase
MHAAVVSGIYILISLSAQAIGLGATYQQVERASEPALRAKARSAFLRRLREWPRGYPGDFETIEYMMEATNHSEPGSLEYFCEEYLLRSPPASQHRNKLWAQAEVIQRVARESPRAKILSLGCGGGLDLDMASGLLNRVAAHVTLCDIEADALALCLKRLNSARVNATVIEGNALQRLPELGAHGPFDLVVAGGLFDYIPDALLKRYLPRMVRDLVRPGGTFFFTNIAKGNPYGTWLRVFGNWQLHERSEVDLRELGLRALGIGGDIGIRRDTTGLAFLIELTRTSAA